MDEINILTDTGKMRAIQEAREEAAEAKGKLDKVRRYLFGAILIVMREDELMELLIKRGEKHKE